MKLAPLQIFWLTFTLCGMIVLGFMPARNYSFSQY
ncbi:DUF624 domain-containing protein [Paenibacillus sp. BSR1-1]